MKNRIVLTVICLFFWQLAICSEVKLDTYIASRIEEARQLLLSDPNGALDLTDKLLLQSNLSEEERGEIYYQQGRIYFKGLHAKDQSIISHYKALRHFRNSKNNERQYATLTYLGRAYKDLYRFDHALDYYDEILSLNLKDSSHILFTKYNIAKVYRLKQDYNTAIDRMQTLVGLFNQQGMVEDVIDCYLEIGLNNIGLENWSEAKKYYQKVFDLGSGQPEEQFFHACALNSLGYVNFKEGFLDQAKKLFEQALPLRVAEGDLNLLVRSYNNLGALEMAKEDKKKAFSYYQQSASLDPKLTDAKQMIEAIESLIWLSKEKDDLNGALYYSEQLNALTVPIIERHTELEILHAQYKADNVRNKIETFELRELLTESRVQIFIIAVLFLITLLLGSWGYYLFRRSKKAENEVITYLKNKASMLNQILLRYGWDEKSIDKLS